MNNLTLQLSKDLEISLQGDKLYLVRNEIVEVNEHKVLRKQKLNITAVEYYLLKHCITLIDGVLSYRQTLENECFDDDETSEEN